MKRVVAGFILLSILFLVGCSTHIHTIGKGPQEFETMEARQWYVLWGLVPINEVNTEVMAGDAVDYEIKTEQNALDILINIFTSAVSVYSRTVTVTK